MLRLALVGLDSSHADHYVRLVEVERRWPGVRVVALVDGEPARRAELAAAGGLSLGAGEVTVPDVVGRVDAAIVAHRAGRLHGAAARTLLRAGVPVLVDKPFAASVADARATLDVARSRDTDSLVDDQLAVVDYAVTSLPRRGARHLLPAPA